MIELMVAIGILIILVGILMFGIKQITGTSKASETRVALENCRGMLSDLDATAKLGSRNAPIQWYQPSQAPGPATPVDLANVTDPDIDFWHMPGKFTGPPDHGLPIFAPTSVKDGETARTKDPYILNTARAMSKIMSMTANRTKVQNLPPNRLFKLPSNPAVGANKVDESQYPIVLDGWGNPILFVPASGMRDVKLNGVTNNNGMRLVTSSKLRDNSANDWANQAVDRPFFASAGPDGDFSTGDDNIYSFEQ